MSCNVRCPAALEDREREKKKKESSGGKENDKDVHEGKLKLVLLLPRFMSYVQLVYYCKKNRQQTKSLCVLCQTCVFPLVP